MYYWKSLVHFPRLFKTFDFMNTTAMLWKNPFATLFTICRLIFKLYLDKRLWMSKLQCAPWKNDNWDYAKGIELSKIENTSFRNVLMQLEIQHKCVYRISGQSSVKISIHAHDNFRYLLAMILWVQMEVASQRKKQHVSNALLCVKLSHAQQCQWYGTRN